MPLGQDRILNQPSLEHTSSLTYFKLAHPESSIFIRLFHSRPMVREFPARISNSFPDLFTAENHKSGCSCSKADVSRPFLFRREVKIKRKQPCVAHHLKTGCVLLHRLVDEHSMPFGAQPPVSQHTRSPQALWRRGKIPSTAYKLIS